MIKVKIFAVNPFREATYVVSDETGEAVVIDCGIQTQKEIERLDDYIEKNNLQLKLAINTHCHIDHILGVNYLIEKYGVKFAASEKDDYLLDCALDSAKMYGIIPPMELVSKIDINLDELKEIKFGNSTLQILPTPGHSKGGVCFFDKESNTLFTGDSLFCGSIGRTDLPGGSYPELMNSILNVIIPIGKDVTIYPGHGDHTTLADELIHNPFITDVLNGNVRYE